MLRSEITVVGRIKAAAVKRTSTKGDKFISFPILVALPDNNNGRVDREMTVYCYNETDPSNLVPGVRVEIDGILDIRKKDNNEYFNIKAEKITTANVPVGDSLTGTTSLYTTIGQRDAVEKTDKNGKPYIVFSGYVCERGDKDKDEYEYIWSRFIGFGMTKQPWMVKGAKIEVKGSLDMSIYEGKLNIAVRLSSMAQRDVSDASQTSKPATTSAPSPAQAQETSQPATRYQEQPADSLLQGVADSIVGDTEEPPF